ncbi:hypothetical protein RKD37_005530 [Streptomyces ambofaciens]
MGAQQVGVRLEGGDAEAVEQVGRVGRGAEAAQAVELGEGADQFGLVVGVLVVAVRGVHGDAPALLVLVTGPGLGEVGVDLEGERGPGGEELEEEGQPGAEPGHGGGAQFLLGVGVDDLGERAPAGAGGGAGVGSHPHLRLRFAGRLGPEEGRDRGGGTPGVGADGVVEAVHELSLPVRACAWAMVRRGQAPEASAR